MTVADVARLLRTSPKAVYAMVERLQLPGVIRIGRRVLFARPDLVRWLNEKRVVSREE
jgi:excisionase family DNA binding protein